MVPGRNTVERFAIRKRQRKPKSNRSNLQQTANMFSCMGGKKPKKQEQNKQKGQQQEQRTVLGNSATTNKPAPNVADYAVAPPPKKALEPMGIRAGEATCNVYLSNIAFLVMVANFCQHSAPTASIFDRADPGTLSPTERKADGRAHWAEEVRISPPSHPAPPAAYARVQQENRNVVVDDYGNRFQNPANVQVRF